MLARSPLVLRFICCLAVCRNVRCLVHEAADAGPSAAESDADSAFEQPTEVKQGTNNFSQGIARIRGVYEGSFAEAAKQGFYALVCLSFPSGGQLCE